MKSCNPNRIISWCGATSTEYSSLCSPYIYIYQSRSSGQALLTSHDAIVHRGYEHLVFAHCSMCRQSFRISPHRGNWQQRSTTKISLLLLRPSPGSSVQHPEHRLACLRAKSLCPADPPATSSFSLDRTKNVSRVAMVGSLDVIGGSPAAMMVV